MTRGYPTVKYKTLGIFEFDQAKALVKQGCKVVYAAVDLRSIRRWRKWGITRERISGVDIYAINIPLGRTPNAVRRLFSIFGLKVLYRRIIREQDIPTIMHAHFTDFAYAALRLKKITGIPLVATEHSSQINKEKIDKDLYTIASEVYHNVDSLIAVSPSLGRMINKHFKISPVYVPNAIDLEIFKYRNRVKDSSFNFVSTANLIDTKRLDLTIEAFYEAFKDEHNVKLTIFGQGPEKKALVGLIKRYNLVSRIILKGLCSRETIAAHLETGDCFVLASQSETFGVSYAEALATGTPVIATRCGGPELFVNEFNGLLIDVNDKKQLVEAMKNMYDHIDQYDRESIAREISMKFSPEVVANKIIKVYGKLKPVNGMIQFRRTEQ